MWNVKIYDKIYAKIATVNRMKSCTESTRDFHALMEFFPHCVSDIFRRTQFRCGWAVFPLAAVEGVNYLDGQFQGFTAACPYCTVLEIPRWLQAIISASHMVPVHNTGNSSDAGLCQHAVWGEFFSRWCLSIEKQSLVGFHCVAEESQATRLAWPASSVSLH